MRAQKIPQKLLRQWHSDADYLSGLPFGIENRKLAMLDASIPKNLLLALAISLLAGIVTAIIASRFISIEGRFESSSTLPALAGAVIGTVGFSRQGASSVMLGLIFAFIGVPFASSVILFAISCASSLAVISLWHWWSGRE